MPIFWLASVTPGAGRSPISSPWHNLSIEIAASCPWATAQMMFFGPNAASPPKNTLGKLDCIVFGSTLGMSQRSNSADVALDPRERVFLADRDEDIVARDVG